MQTYVRPNLVFTHGEGARLYDAHGKEYLDFAAGIAVNALGNNQCWTCTLSPVLQHTSRGLCQLHFYIIFLVFRFMMELAGA